MRRRFLRWVAPELQTRRRAAEQELAFADRRLDEAKRAAAVASRRLRMLESRIELLRLGNGHT